MKTEKENSISKTQETLDDKISVEELERKVETAKKRTRGLRQRAVLAAVKECDELQKIARKDKSSYLDIKGQIELLWLIQVYAGPRDFAYSNEEVNLIRNARFIIESDFDSTSVSQTSLKSLLKAMREEILYRLRSVHADSVLTYTEIAVLIMALEPCYLKVFDYRKKNFGLPGLRTKKTKKVLRVFRDFIEHEVGDEPEKRLYAWAQEMDAKKGN